MSSFSLTALPSSLSAGISTSLNWNPNRYCSSSFRLPRIISCFPSKGPSDSVPLGDNSSSDLNIEEAYNVQMQMQEIEDNISSRPNRILLVEETSKALKQLYFISFSLVSGIILYGGVVSPSMELNFGFLEDFIRSVHLSLQSCRLDQVVASFSVGAIGVVSTLMVLRVNNIQQQQKKRCKYCRGSGYLACARCFTNGVHLMTGPAPISSDSNHPVQAPTTQRCPNCSGLGKGGCGPHDEAGVFKVLV